MKRICVICEGQTEEMFVSSVLAPRFCDLNLFLEGQTVATSVGHKGGALNYARIKGHIEKILKNQDQPCVTTLVDLYQLGTDFPDFNKAMNLPLPKKLTCLTDAWHKDIIQSTGCQPERFLPYIQAHEFEALLFSDVTAITETSEQWQKATKELQAIKDKAESPEYINNTAETKPTAHFKRLLPRPSYKKVRHGSIIMQKIGLNVIEQECHFFAEWVKNIRNFSKEFEC